MDIQKLEWIKLCENILFKYYPKDAINLIFKADENNHIYKINDKYFIPCDAILSSPDGLHIFQFFTNKNKKYRCSIENKFFWEIDLITNKKTRSNTNWVQIFKIGKQNLDKQNNKYNRFYLMTFNINFEGSGKGIYGVTPTTIKSLFDSRYNK